MDAARLHKLARQLQLIALTATREGGEDAVPVTTVAIVEDLSRNGPTTVGEIAKRTGVAQSQVSGLIGELRTAGLATSYPDPNDGRRRLITVSAAGKRMFRGRGRTGISDALAQTYPTVAAPARARTERLLDELADRLLATE